MKQMLIVSFDLLRPHDPKPSFSIATLLAYARQSDACRSGQLRVMHEPFNMHDLKPVSARDVVVNLAARYSLAELDFVALAVYIWSEKLVLALMPMLRKAGFRGGIILGGYQITATPEDKLFSTYPGADYFVKGYAESALVSIATNSGSVPKIWEEPPDFGKLPSIYLSEVLPIVKGQSVDMLRWETKRGCPYRCGFCEWRNAANKEVYEFPLVRIEQELALFRQHKISKINVLDATFNVGKTYLHIAELMTAMDCKFSVQARFENLHTKAGCEFLDICRAGNINLEFGVQTVIPGEMKTIGRTNDLEKMTRGMAMLNELRIPYEVSLIYGIPGQTLQTFLESVNFVFRNGCANIKCFPLRIPRGSKMEEHAIANCVGTSQIDHFSIDMVAESYSFDSRDWRNMTQIAAVLGSKGQGEFVIFRKQGLSWVPVETRAELSIALPEEAGEQPAGVAFLKYVPANLAQLVETGGRRDVLIKDAGSDRRAAIVRGTSYLSVYVM